MPFPIYENKPEHLAIIKKMVNEMNYPIVFNFSPCEHTCFVMMICESYLTLQSPVYGGQASTGDRVMVGIMYAGFFHLPKEPVHFNYIAEKFRIPEPDAKGVADLWEFLYKTEGTENADNRENT